MKTRTKTAVLPQRASGAVYEMILEAMEEGRLFQAIVLQERHAVFAKEARFRMGLES